MCVRRHPSSDVTIVKNDTALDFTMNTNECTYTKIDVAKVRLALFENGRKEEQ